MRVFFQAAQPRRERAAPDPDAAARQPHRWRAGPVPAPAVEGGPGYPQLGGHLLDRQQRVARGSGCRRPGWRGPAGSGWRSRGRPVRGSATTDAPLRPPRQVRPPAGIAAAGRGPGRPARATGKRGKAPRAALRGGAACAAGGPALPEGKAGRGGRGVVPGGDPVRAVAVAGGGGGRPGCRPAGRAGLPPGTAGIQPPLRPPRQVRPARCRGGLDTRPRATRRCGPAPGPARRGRPSGRAARRAGTAKGARWRAPRGCAPPSYTRPPGGPATGTPGRALRVMLTGGSVIGRSLAPRWFSVHYRNRVFGAFFRAAPRKRCW